MSKCCILRQKKHGGSTAAPRPEFLQDRPTSTAALRSNRVCLLKHAMYCSARQETAEETPRISFFGSSSLSLHERRQYIAIVGSGEDVGTVLVARARVSSTSGGIRLDLGCTDRCVQPRPGLTGKMFYKSTEEVTKVSPPTRTLLAD